MIRSLASFVFGMIDHVAMLFSLFFAVMSLFFLVIVTLSPGPDGSRDWSDLALPGGIYMGTLLIRLVCRKIIRMQYVSPYPPLKPLDLSRYTGKRP